MRRAIRKLLKASGCSVILAVIAILSLAAPICALAQSSITSADLDLLLARKQYDRFEQALGLAASLTARDRAYYNGMLANRLNRPSASVHLLESLVPVLVMSNTLHAENAICALADDYAKLSRYADAAKAYDQAAQLPETRGGTSLCDAGHEARRWSLLKDLPPPTVVNGGAVSLKAQRDSLGLMEVPVTAGAYKGEWIIDTGASLSVISKSVADQMGISISAPGGDAEGTSGIAVPVRVGLIAELHLGSAVIRNVPVLVADDSELTFPSLNFRINGCVGLPVIAALRTISVSRDGDVSFGSPVPRVSNSHNLFLERMVPVIVADLGHGSELFTVDTGAIGTMLSSAFYEEENSSSNLGDLVSFELSGAGGSLITTAYQVRGINPTVAGQCVFLPEAVLLTEKATSTDEFHGNIGQSILSLFASYTFDFEHMYFSVSGGTTTNCTEMPNQK